MMIWEWLRRSAFIGERGHPLCPPFCIPAEVSPSPLESPRRDCFIYETRLRSDKRIISDADIHT